MNGACNSNFFLALPPGALERGQKVKYHLISITKSISKIFIPNFVCILTNERYKTYQTAGGGRGVKNFSMGICDGAPSTAHSSYVLVQK